MQEEGGGGRKAAVTALRGTPSAGLLWGRDPSVVNTYKWRQYFPRSGSSESQSVKYYRWMQCPFPLGWRVWLKFPHLKVFSL